jgi:hypothetical protein
LQISSTGGLERPWHGLGALQQVLEPLAAELGDRVTEHLRGGWVRERDQTRGVDPADTLAGCVEDRLALAAELIEVLIVRHPLGAPLFEFFARARFDAFVCQRSASLP